MGAVKTLSSRIVWIGINRLNCAVGKASRLNSTPAATGTSALVAGGAGVGFMSVTCVLLLPGPAAGDAQALRRPFRSAANTTAVFGFGKVGPTGALWRPPSPQPAVR